MPRSKRGRRRPASRHSRLRESVDAAFYEASYRRLLDEDGMAPGQHFERIGLARGCLPLDGFDPCVYLVGSDRPISFNRDGSFSYDQGTPTALESLRRHIDTIDVSRIYGATTGRERNLFAKAERAKNLAAAPGYSEGYSRSIEWSGGTLTHSAPSFAEFHTRLNERTPTTYVKIPHGFWDSLVFTEGEQSRLLADPAFGALNDDQAFSLARRMVGLLRPEIGVFAEAFFEDALSVLATAVQLDDVHLSFSFKGYPTWDNRLFIVPGNADEERVRLDKLASHVPPGFEFCDGTLFKRWTLSGDLPEMMRSIRDRPILLVGSASMAPLVAHFSFSRAVFHEIPGRNSHWHRYRLLGELSAHIESLGPADAPVVMTRASGSLSFWLLMRLRERFPEASFLDLGQSINPYLIDAPDTNWTSEYQQILFQGG